MSASGFLRRQGWRSRANHWEHPKYPDVLHHVESALLQAGMWLEQEAQRQPDRLILTEVLKMFDRSPQWFEVHLPTLYGLLRSHQIAHVARVMGERAQLENTRAVRGEGSQHDLPSRTAHVDAAIQQPGQAPRPCAEVAPLGGGYGATVRRGSSES
jgi:hypothetical protein